MTAKSPIVRRWHVSPALKKLIANRRGDVVAGLREDGSVYLLPADDTADKPKILSLFHEPIVELTQDADEHAFLVVGNQGTVAILDPDLDIPTELANAASAQLATGGVAGFRAFAEGSTLHVFDPEGTELTPIRHLETPVSALAFSPDGMALAVRDQNNVFLFQLNDWTRAACRLSVDSRPAYIDAQSASHLFWASDGSFVIAVEKGGHFASQKDLLLTPVASRLEVKSLPASKSASNFLGEESSRLLTCFAPHPTDPVVVLGHDDGLITLSPLDGRKELMIQTPGLAPVLSLVWNADGSSLFAALASGDLFLFTRRKIGEMIRV